MRKAKLLLLFIRSYRENKPEKLLAFLTLAKDLDEYVRICENM